MLSQGSSSSSWKGRHPAPAARGVRRHRDAVRVARSPHPPRPAGMSAKSSGSPPRRDSAKRRAAPRRLMIPCARAPSETIPQPGSSGVRSSASSQSAICLAFRSGATLSSKSSATSRWGSSDRPSPQAALRLRMAMTAKTMPRAAPAEPLAMPVMARAAARSASPTTPPRPLGRGQRSVAGIALASAVAAPAPMTHRARRNWRRPSSPDFISRQPQTASGSRAAMEPRPRICMARSATMAPGQPRRLRTGESVALLRLGSSTDHVASEAATRPAIASSASPISSCARRATKARRPLARPS